MIGFMLLVFWTLIMWGSFLANWDVFSPAKMYLICVLLFFADIFVTPYDGAVTLTYAALLFLGLVLSIQESLLVRQVHFPPVNRSPASAVTHPPVAPHSRIDRGRLVPAKPAPAVRVGGHGLTARHLWLMAVLLWVLSVIPVVSQLYLVTLMGGFENYVNTLGNRVIEQRGLGILIMAIRTLPTINIVYFSVGLLSRKAGAAWWGLFLIHMLVLVVFGLATGSRGALLNSFAIMTISFNYIRHKVSPMTAIIVVAGIMAAAGVLGIARNGYKMGAYGIETGLSKSDVQFENTHFKYGLIPLELIFSRPPEDLRLGMTFATVFTNLVPRTLWPDKPDTGGVILTKEYTGDAWDGASNLSTGLIAESVINFGWGLGVPIGFVLLWLTMSYVLSSYVRLLRSRKDLREIPFVRLVLIHVIVMSTATSLLCGEFTSTMVTAVVGRLFPLVCIVWMIARVRGREC